MLTGMFRFKPVSQFVERYPSVVGYAVNMEVSFPTIYVYSLSNNGILVCFLGPTKQLTDILDDSIYKHGIKHNLKLATTGGLQFTEPLPRSGRRDTHTDTKTDGRDL
jgi:hypothetical protein